MPASPQPAARGADLGFDGKTLIHPKQIAAANAAFAPSPAEVDHARRLIAAHKEAAAQGKGVTLLDGRLVEVLHVAEAERLLAQADAIAAFERSASAKGSPFIPPHVVQFPMTPLV